MLEHSPLAARHGDRQHLPLSRLKLDDVSVIGFRAVDHDPVLVGRRRFFHCGRAEYGLAVVPTLSPGTLGSEIREPRPGDLKRAGSRGAPQETFVQEGRAPAIILHTLTYTVLNPTHLDLHGPDSETHTSTPYKAR